MKENPNFTVPPYDLLATRVICLPICCLLSWGLLTKSLSVLAKEGQVEKVKNLLQDAQDASSFGVFLRKKHIKDKMMNKKNQKKTLVEGKK